MLGRLSSFIYIVIISSLISSLFALPPIGGIIVFILTAVFMFGFVNDKLQKISVINASVNFGLSFYMAAGIGYYINKYLGLPARALLIIALLWGAGHIATTLIYDEWDISGHTIPCYLISGAIYSSALYMTFFGYGINPKIMAIVTVAGAIGYMVFRKITTTAPSEDMILIRRLDQLINKIELLRRMTKDPAILSRAEGIKAKILYVKEHLAEIDDFEALYNSMASAIEALIYEHIRSYGTAEAVQELKFFGGCNGPAEIRKRYRELVKQYHPDSPGGNAEIFEEVTKEYNKILGKV